MFSQGLLMAALAESELIPQKALNEASMACAGEIFANETHFVIEILSICKLPWENFITYLANEKQIPIINSINDFLPNPIPLIENAFLQENVLYPLKISDTTLTVLACNPFHSSAFDYLHFVTQKQIAITLASPSMIQKFIHFHSEPVSTFPAINENVSQSEHPTILCIQNFLKKALLFKASDIHIESMKDQRMRIRYRINGLLQNDTQLSLEASQNILTKLKLMAHMDISEKRIPQDGRFQVNLDKTTFDVRASSIPSIYGETITLRILEKSQTKHHLQDIGLPDVLAGELHTLITQTKGLILAAGPTGSGKTTTLYALLHELIKTHQKIITVENPVEYQIEGINQVQVKPEIDMTFAAALRSILRQNPDTILIGEIRDTETAHIAIQIALSGHLVLSSIHTTDAISAITRLANLDIPTYLISEALSAVIAQRLPRCLCPHCKTPYQPSEQEWNSINLRTPTPNIAYQSTGCMHCHNTGFSKRTGIFERLLCSKDVKNAIRSSTNISTIRQNILRNTPFPSLMQNGACKVLDGSVSIKELLRVVLL